MEGYDVFEIALRGLRQGNFTVCRLYIDFDTVPVERRHCVFEADAKLSYHPSGILQFFDIFVLGEMFISEAAAEIANHPSAVV